MAPNPDSRVITMETTRQGLAALISTTVALSIGISIAAAAVVLAAGMWLER